MIFHDDHALDCRRFVKCRVLCARGSSVRVWSLFLVEQSMVWRGGKHEKMKSEKSQNKNKEKTPIVVCSKKKRAERDSQLVSFIFHFIWSKHETGCWSCAEKYVRRKIVELTSYCWESRVFFLAGRENEGSAFGHIQKKKASQHPKRAHFQEKHEISFVT